MRPLAHSLAAFGDETRTRLLVILAHPDDETFRCGGTLALLARRGVDVRLLTATRGEAGSCGEPPLCRPSELAVVRERELRCACAALGLRPPLLLDYGDGTLAAQDEEIATRQITEIIEQLRPQTLLSWPLDGLSGHPDHQAVSRWATRAFHRSDHLGTAAPVSLYYLAVPRSVAHDLNLTRLHAIPDEEVTLAVDVSPVWGEKMAAIHCHRTQAGASPILAAPEMRQRRFLGTEHFRRAAARSASDLLLALKQPL